MRCPSPSRTCPTASGARGRPTPRSAPPPSCSARRPTARAKRLGMSRAQFLRTAAGTATAFMVLNTVHGLDQTGDAAPLPVTARAVRRPRRGARAVRRPTTSSWTCSSTTSTSTASTSAEPRLPALSRAATCRCAERLAHSVAAQLIKEVFVDSETAVGVISGVPNGVPLPVETMAATRDLVNELAGSQRALSQAMCDPTQPARHPDRDRQPRAPGDATSGPRAQVLHRQRRWWLDDEDVAYPMLEEATRLGLRLINVHKGFPRLLGADGRDLRASRDLPKVSRDWPRLNFVAYHSGYFRGDSGAHRHRRVPRRRALASAAGATSTPRSAAPSRSPSPQGPTEAAHLIGSLLKTLGPEQHRLGHRLDLVGLAAVADRRLQGARRFPPAMQEQFGYPPLTERAKRRILGLNAARLYRVKVRETRCAIDADQLERPARRASAARKRRAPISSTGRARGASSCAC